MTGQNLPALDAKTRRQQQDAQRMRFRRAIEHYADNRRLQDELSDFPGALSSPATWPARTTSASSAR